MHSTCLAQGGPGQTGSSSLTASHDPVSGHGVLSYQSRGLGSGGFPGCIFLGGVMNVPTFSEQHPYTLPTPRSTLAPVIGQTGFGWGFRTVGNVIPGGGILGGSNGSDQRWRKGPSASGIP